MLIAQDMKVVAVIERVGHDVIQVKGFKSTRILLLVPHDEGLAFVTLISLVMML